jgi:hypothetical protein
MWAGQQKKVGVVDVQKFELVPRFGDFRTKFKWLATVSSTFPTALL